MAAFDQIQSNRSTIDLPNSIPEERDSVSSNDLPILRINPSWSVGIKPHDPEDEHSYRLRVSNDGGMAGSFTPLALQVNANPDLEFKRLELRALPGYESVGLVNPKGSIFFELIAEPKRPISEGETVVLELLYAGISTQTSEWYLKDRDPAVLSLPVALDPTAGREER